MRARIIACMRMHAHGSRTLLNSKIFKTLDSSIYKKFKKILETFLKSPRKLKILQKEGEWFDQGVDIDFFFHPRQKKNSSRTIKNSSQFIRMKKFVWKIHPDELQCQCLGYDPLI
jgi:hypothetical protein